VPGFPVLQRLEQPLDVGRRVDILARVCRAELIQSVDDDEQAQSRLVHCGQEFGDDGLIRPRTGRVGEGVGGGHDREAEPTLDDRVVFGRIVRHHPRQRDAVGEQGHEPQALDIAQLGQLSEQAEGQGGLTRTSSPHDQELLEQVVRASEPLSTPEKVTRKEPGQGGIAGVHDSALHEVPTGLRETADWPPGDHANPSKKMSLNASQIVGHWTRQLGSGRGGLVPVELIDSGESQPRECRDVPEVLALQAGGPQPRQKPRLVFRDARLFGVGVDGAFQSEQDKSLAVMPGEDYLPLRVRRCLEAHGQ